jgi:SAM-dependent methyltransferase
VSSRDYAPLIARERKGAGEFYKGIRQKTDTALHEQLVDYIRTSFHGRKLRILDWGGGEGALSERLADEGHEVVAVDVNQESWKGSGAGFFQLDFNDQAAVDDFVERHKDAFDLIVSTEVIEHIESPWAFLRQLRKFDCDIIITTPNISSWWCRFWFFMTGDIWGFRQESWVEPGHINPIGIVEMTNMLADVGFVTRQIRPAGRLPIIWLYNWKRALISLLIFPLRPLMRGYKDGWALCFHASPK